MRNGSGSEHHHVCGVRVEVQEFRSQQDTPISGHAPDIGVCPDFGSYPKSAYTPISAHTPMNKDDGCTHSTNCSNRPKLRSGSKLPRHAPKVATGGARSHVPGREAAGPGALELAVGAHHAAGLRKAARGVPQGRRHIWQATH